MFDFAVGRWVCVDFYLVSSFEPYRELVQLVCLVVNVGEILDFSETLRSFRLVVVVVVCSVVFFCVLLLRGSCLLWCPTVTTRCSGRVRV